MRKFSANDKCMKCRYYCKKFIAFLFSHVGLCGLVVAYVIVGAWTFSALENKNEIAVKKKAQLLHNKTVDDLWNITARPGPTVQLQDASPPTTSLVDPREGLPLKQSQLDRLRRDATQDLWNITLEMNVLFEKNWTALVNERILQYQNHLLDILLNDTLHPNVSSISSDDVPPVNDTLLTKTVVRRRLYEYQKDILREVREFGYDGNDTDGGPLQWGMAGGLLYSLTVITTIGYGHIAPKTIEGKVITILYAIMGIPLMLLCLANIGDALAHAFKFFYWKICCLYCEMKKRRQRLMRIQSVRMSRKPNRSPASMPNSIGMNSMHSSFRAKQHLSLPAEKPSELMLPNTHTLIRISSASPTPEEKSLQGSMDLSGATTEVATTSNDQSSEILNTNINGGNPVPPLAVTDDLDGGHSEDRLVITISQDDDTGRRKMSVCNMPPETIDGIDYVDESPQPSPTHLSPDETTAVIVHDMEEDDDHMRDFHPRYEKQSVPVYVCLLVVFGYIMGGAILFATWEGWKWWDGAYFCFITLTTIGFGDFVPGVSNAGDVTQNSEQKLALCSLYLVFGMALLAMSFNLVQEAVTEKAKWVARKIGILSDDSEEED